MYNYRKKQHTIIRCTRSHAQHANNSNGSRPLANQNSAFSVWRHITS